MSQETKDVVKVIATAVVVIAVVVLGILLADAHRKIDTLTADLEIVRAQAATGLADKEFIVPLTEKGTQGKFAIAGEIGQPRRLATSRLRL